MSDDREDPLRHWPDRTPLVTSDGRTLLVYSAFEGLRDGRPWADGVWRPEDVEPAEAVEGSLRYLAGYAVSTTDQQLVDGWLAAGATTMRHAHAMTNDLADVPETVPGDDALHVHQLTAAQVARHADRLGAICFAAYPPDHPDHAHESVRAAADGMHLVASGQVLGPLLDVSHVAVKDHTIVGAALIVDRPGSSPEGGPWVLDIFRDPASPARGVGRALLVSVLRAAKDAGLASISLVVSHDNVRAFGLYESLGFIDQGQSWTLGLPADAS